MVITFILGIVWIGSAALYMNLGLSGGWASVLGFVTALILGPAIDAGLGALTGKSPANGTAQPGLLDDDQVVGDPTALADESSAEE